MTNKIGFLIGILSALASASAHAISEVNYKNVYRSSVVPFYESGTAGKFSGIDGVEIAYRVFEVPSEKGAIVLLPGRTESLRKYAEVIFDLTQKGYSVFAMEHRGQGESGRMTRNPQVGYVAYFDDYVADLETFMGQVVNSKPHSKKLLLAHSMGGEIGARFVINHPNEFEAVVFSSPMFQINTKQFPEALAYELTSLSCALFQGKSYAITQSDWNFGMEMSDPANEYTTSETRFEVLIHDLLNEHPELALGGPSNRWMQTSIEATADTRSQASRFAVPVLILQAGADTIVKTSAQTRFCAEASSCELVAFISARHEILMERDSIRNLALGQALRFFESN